MTTITKQELGALLELIQKKKYELLTDCRAWKRSVKGVLDRDEAQPRNKEERQLGHIPAPNSDLVFKYSSAVEYTDIDFRKTYLDVSEYWEKFYQEYLTAEEYLSKVMEVHWFLLYYTHRLCLTNWKKAWPSAIWLKNSNAVSIKEIDTFLNYFLDYWGPLYSRETIQDFMTFAAKSIGAVAPVNIIDIYDDDNLDDSARVDALRALLDSLPFTKGIAFTEVLDSLLFTLDQGCYKEIFALQRVFCSGIPSDRYLYIQDEFFEKSFDCIKKRFPHVLPPYFEDADALLNGIKQEFAANRELVDDGVCWIVDSILDGSFPGAVYVDGNEQEPQSVVAAALHWPTQEEYDGYPLTRNDTEFFKESVFGMAAAVKVSDVEKLYNLLVSQKVLQDDIETKLILLARYSGRKIPLLELRPIEWIMPWSDKERALGYLLLRTAKAAYANGVKFFYYNDNGEEMDLDVRAVSVGAHNWKNRINKPDFVKALDALIQEELGFKYPED